MKRDDLKKNGCDNETYRLKYALVLCKTECNVIFFVN